MVLKTKMVEELKKRLIPGSWPVFAPFLVFTGLVPCLVLDLTYWTRQSGLVF